TASRPRSPTPTRCGSSPRCPAAVTEGPDDKRGGPAYRWRRAMTPSERGGRRHGGTAADRAADDPGGRWGGPVGRLAGRAVAAAQPSAAAAGPECAGADGAARGAAAGGLPAAR